MSVGIQEGVSSLKNANMVLALPKAQAWICGYRAHHPLEERGSHGGREGGPGWI